MRAADQAAASPAEPLLRALDQRDFRLFFGGMIASLIGLWLQITALSWVMYELTGSAALVGALFLATQAPSLFLGPIAGVYSDRMAKRTLLVLAQGAAIVPAFGLAVLSWTGRSTPLLLLLLAAVAGIARAFEVPTRQSWLPRLVPRAALANAIALNSIAFNIARLIGPAAAGLLLPAFGAAVCFVLNGILGVVVVATMLRVGERGAPDPARARASLLAELMEGVQYVRSQPVLRALMGCLVTLSLFGMPYGTLLPSFAERQLGRGAGAYSALQVAVALGALATALVLSRRRGARGLERWVPAAGLTFGVLLATLSQVPSLALALVVLALLGSCFMAQSASSNVLTQTIVPDGLRGRVMSLHTTLFLGVYPFAGLAAGWCSDRWGERVVLLACGGLMIAGIASYSPRLVRGAQELGLE